MSTIPMPTRSPNSTIWSYIKAKYNLLSIYLGKIKFLFGRKKKDKNETSQEDNNYPLW